MAHVSSNSLAAAAGIRDEDLLLAIDQLDVTSWKTRPGILPLSRFWERPPATVLELTLRRGTRTVKLKVTLRTILGPSE